MAKFTLTIRRHEEYTAKIQVEAESYEAAVKQTDELLCSQGWDAVYRDEGEYEECYSHVDEPSRPLPPLTPNVRSSIENLLEYNWSDEFQDCFDCREGEGEATTWPETHIFYALVEISNWLNGESRTSESYLKELRDDDDDCEGSESTTREPDDGRF